jgi:tripartite-type tricarboxylate transporter receptor subunit TctC
MKKFQKVLGILTVLFLMLSLPAPSPSSGQEYPAKPVQLVVCYPPGGLSPVISTLFAEEAKKYSPTPLVVVYKPGAGGSIGFYSVAKSHPDGYTLLSGVAGPISVMPLIQKMDYSPADFVMVAQIVRTPLTFAVKTDAPWKSLTELVAYAKKNPGAVMVGNSGTNTSMHLHVIRFEKTAGIKVTHVPFKGAADSMAAVAGGHLSVAARWPGEAEPLVDAGKVRVLTVFAPSRSKYYPNVPTSREEGLGMEAAIWVTLMAPKGTPKPILNFWEKIIEKTTRDPAFIEKAEKLKMNIEFKGSEEFTKDLRKEIQDFGEIIRELGLKVN